MTWHKAAIVFIFGGAGFVFAASLISHALMWVTVGLWVVVAVSTWIAEGRGWGGYEAEGGGSISSTSKP
jgi:hypothetical protein